MTTKRGGEISRGADDKKLKLQETSDNFQTPVAEIKNIIESLQMENDYSVWDET